MAYIRPRQWSREELELAAKRAGDEFAEGRRSEGIEQYLLEFDSAAEEVKGLLAESGDLLDLRERAGRLFGSGRLEAIRYVPSPVISADDLKKLSEIESLSEKTITEPENAQKIIEVVQDNLDPRRFPWVEDGRIPTPAERDVAVVSTASLMAGQRAQTKRRTLARQKQENALAEFLEMLGYSEVGRRHVRNLIDAPRGGEYCRECKVGGKKADIVLGLYDGRFMAVECKVSNSEVNSFKRLNHETVEKVSYWNLEFGSSGVLGAAVLAGVFKPANLLAAQEEGVSIFWSFDLVPLGDFIEATKR